MAFWDNIRFPYFNFQELNLDWIMSELKRIAGFMPQDGNVGDILTRKSEGAAWEPPEAVNININALPEDTEIGDNDQLIFYDISAQANRKIKPPNLLDSMMSNGTPLMDGTASPGTSKKPARYDHKHPTDTSRQAALSGTQMNAVNSGAPANAFSSNALKVENGGTGATTIADAQTNLHIGIKEVHTTGNWRWVEHWDGWLDLVYEDEAATLAFDTLKGSVYTQANQQQVDYPVTVYHAAVSIDAYANSNVNMPWAGQISAFQSKANYRLFNPTSVASMSFRFVVHVTGYKTDIFA